MNDIIEVVLIFDKEQYKEFQMIRSMIRDPILTTIHNALEPDIQDRYVCDVPRNVLYELICVIERRVSETHMLISRLKELAKAQLVDFDWTFAQHREASNRSTDWIN